MGAEDKEYNKRRVKSDLFTKNYYSDQLKENETGRGHVAFMGDMKNSYILVRTPKGKKPIQKHGRRWEGSNRMAVI
jgi:hypothetical protein